MFLLSSMTLMPLNKLLISFEQVPKMATGEG